MNPAKKCLQAEKKERHTTARHQKLLRIDHDVVFVVVFCLVGCFLNMDACRSNLDYLEV